jgi:hypothetical protein
MTTDLRSPRPPTSSLNDQIREVGDRLLNRRRLVRARGDTLGRILRQRMAAPAMLLLAGGLGFLMGELTRRQTPRSRGMDRSPDSGHPLFESALNLIKLVNWARTFFVALSGAGTRPSSRSETSVQIPEPPFRLRGTSLGEAQPCDPPRSQENSR